MGMINPRRMRRMARGCRLVYTVATYLLPLKKRVDLVKKLY